MTKLLLRITLLLHVSVSAFQNNQHFLEGIGRSSTLSRLFALSPLHASAQDKGNHISIEYCTGCRWMLRSAWMAQELLTTFQDDDELDSVSLIPSRAKPGGVFCVRRKDNEILWDRKAQGRFPESKELKQRVRDLITPNKGLGHSDSTTIEGRANDAVASSEESARTKREDCQECNGEVEALSTPLQESASGPPSPNVAITYCTGCRWLLRSTWIMQELFTTFDTELNSITLIPSRPPAKGGIFTVMLDGEVLWDRAEEGAFPQPKELKQMIRERINPSLDLGHSDGKPAKADFETMDDDDAEEMRKYFGVM